VTDGRLERGARTRTTVLDAAVATASVDGLEGMSLAQLAGLLGLSKSGLFAHWPDKEQLQLDVVAHARRQWIEHIVEPAMRKPPGLQRLWALHVRRLRFYADEVLPGRCFFAAVQPEFDDKPGPVREAINVATDAWMSLLERQVRDAVRLGQLSATTAPAQLAFEVQALGEAVVTRGSSGPRDAALARRHSRRAVLDRLRALATGCSDLPKE
jgi:AcrR family transcriptional regulator